MTISIVIADDHTMLRAGLRSLLNAEPDFHVIGEAPDGDEALSVVQSLRPDVLLADISMPGPSGIEVARRLRKTVPETRVLIVTMHEDEGLLNEALSAGAAGYIPKRAAESELTGAIRTVVRGAIYTPPEMKGRVPSVPQVLPGNRASVLDHEDSRLLRLVAEGHSNQQIGDELGLTADAVYALRMELAERLGLHSRVDFVRYAQGTGIL